MTYDHEIERDHDEPFDPVRLRVGRDVVDQKAAPENSRNLVEICGRGFLGSIVRKGRRKPRLTEQER